MQKFALLFLAGLFVFVGAACNGTTSTDNTATNETVAEVKPAIAEKFTAQEIEGFKLYEHNNFYFYYPADWTMEEGGGVIVSVYSPLVDENDVTSENCNVVLDNTAADYSMEEYLAASKALLGQYINDYEPLEEGEIEMGEAQKGDYIVYNGTQGQLNLTWAQYLLKPNADFYVLTCTASQETYADYVDVFDLMASYFVGL